MNSRLRLLAALNPWPTNLLQRIQFPRDQVGICAGTARCHGEVCNITTVNICAPVRDWVCRDKKKIMGACVGRLHDVFCPRGTLRCPCTADGVSPASPCSSGLAATLLRPRRRLASSRMHGPSSRRRQDLLCATARHRQGRLPSAQIPEVGHVVSSTSML